MILPNHKLPSSFSSDSTRTKAGDSPGPRWVRPTKRSGGSYKMHQFLLSNFQPNTVGASYMRGCNNASRVADTVNRNHLLSLCACVCSWHQQGPLLTRRVSGATARPRPFGHTSPHQPSVSASPFPPADL
ncbi:hypothetical protein BD289DRAFT_188247 [Coniella lustricola]|uniref:Uncharacterized protein n=1 Tax=Coniella lustricola TaxID=2025994 RepID=A0A2T2ZSY2_9PEZI|nr:hypothetical protein BD289DRAFT_188247 [Coniella lustricola]